MLEKEPVIVVAGDVTVDWFMYPVKPLDEGENWRLHHALHSDALIGGAALLSKFIEQSLDEENIQNVVMVKIYQMRVSYVIFRLIR